MAPDSKVEKVYLVETVNPISERAVAAFAEGFYFDYEGVVTRPARLELLGSHRARVTLEEGKYHQIKRMFHRLDGNRLVSLHRESMGDFVLPADLKAGEGRVID
jgi:16S rRNA pseudouridine516 synthase